MKSPLIILKSKVLGALFLMSFFGMVFAQDLHPSHAAYNSLTSVVDAMKLERKSCAEFGHYPQVGQSLCATIGSVENFRNDWDLIVNQTGSSFGLSPLGDWKSEPARGIIHRTYLLGSTDLKVNYDVISSRITIDVLDPELQAQEEARRIAQAEADAAQQAAQAAYDQQVAQQAAQSQTANQTASQTINGYDVSAAYPAQQAQAQVQTQTQAQSTDTGYYATNADGTTFALVDSAATTVVTTEQVVTTTTQDYAATPVANNTSNTAVESRAYAPATTAQTNYDETTAQTTTASGYPTTAETYTQPATQGYQAVAPAATQAQAATIAYAYTPTNLITIMGNTAQNSAAFQPNGAWQITSSGSPATINLYDTTTQAFVRTVYPDQIYTDAGNYYLSINSSDAWALSVWTE